MRGLRSWISPHRGFLTSNWFSPLPDSPVTRFLEKGGGLHHLCYEVDNLEARIQRMKSQLNVLC